MQHWAILKLDWRQQPHEQDEKTQIKEHILLFAQTSFLNIITHSIKCMTKKKIEIEKAKKIFFLFNLGWHANKKRWARVGGEGAVRFGLVPYLMCNSTFTTSNVSIWMVPRLNSSQAKPKQTHKICLTVFSFSDRIHKIKEFHLFGSNLLSFYLSICNMCICFAFISLLLRSMRDEDDQISQENANR